MFRSLATRLTATYVFAAIVLVVIVIAAVTAFSLSMYGIGVRESQDQVALQVPEEVKLELARYASLEAAAPDIARHLSRPGLRVVVLGRQGTRLRPLAVAFPGNAGGATPRVVQPRHGFGGPGFGGPWQGVHGVDEGSGGLAFGSGFASGHSGPHGGPAGPQDGPPDARGPAGPHGFDDGPGSDRMAQYPFSLSGFLQLAPRAVDFTNGRVMLLPDPGDLGRGINAFWIAMLWTGVFVVVAAWLLGRFITGQALRPLVETTASLRRFGDGDFTPRPVETSARDEIGQLAQAYNAAAAQVSAAFEERAAAEIEMRQFIADAGHELRTPLTVIMGFVDVLRRRSLNEAGASTKIYDTMLDESRRMKTLIDKLIVLARLENSRPREFETVDLAQIADTVATSLRALGAEHRIDVQASPDALVRGYESELHDAVSNLIENALKYAPESPVAVRVSIENDDVCLEVADRGPGIPLDEQTHVFSRFYRGRDRVESEGFGLGLAIAKRAVERASGTLTLVSAPGRGSRFTLRLPRATRGETVALAV